MERCPSGGEGLVLLAAAAAISLAQGRSTEELECLSAFFPFWGISWPSSLSSGGRASRRPRDRDVKCL